MQNILIVDDKSENLFVLEKILERLQVNIIKASSGREAIQKCEDNEFALAILDIQMPEMDGYELAEIIRSDEKTKFLPILFLSAVYSDDFNIFKGYKSGGVDFITKPFNTEILLSKVRIFLELDKQKISLKNNKIELEQLVKTLQTTNQKLNKEINARKDIEQALNENKEKLKAIINSIPDLIFYKNKELKYQGSNKAFELFTTKTELEIYGNTDQDLFNGNLLEMLILNDENVISKGTIVQYEKIINIQSHKELLFETIKAPYYNADGEIAGLVGISRDVTERMKAQIEIAKREAQYRMLAENMADVIWTINTKTFTFDFITPSVKELLKYTPDQLTNKPIDALMSEESQKKIRKVIEGFLQKKRDITKKSTLLIIDYLCKDNSNVWTETLLTPLYDKNDNLEKILGVSRDVTKKLLTENALQVSEERYKTLIEQASDGVIVADLAANIKDVNTQGCEMLEYKKDKLKEMNFLSFVSQQDQTKIQNALRLIQKKLLIVEEIELKKRDGTSVFVEIYANLLSDGRIHAILRNISKRVLTEQKLKFALEKEKELNQLKSRFISTVSHEFRTPLAGISSSSELLQRYDDKWNITRKKMYFQQIKEAVRHMTLMLDEVSFIGKDESGRILFNPSVFNFEEFLLQLINEISSFYSFKNKINFINKSNLGKVVMDKTLVRHIITNVLSNAVKYGKEKDVDLIIDKKDQKAHIFIKDYGIGIPKEDLKHIFEPFHRSENVQEIQGSGLGMSIVKRCIDAHNAEIDIKSDINKGTLVSIIMPVSI